MTEELGLESEIFFLIPERPDLEYQKDSLWDPRRIPRNDTEELRSESQNLFFRNQEEYSLELQKIFFGISERFYFES